MSILIICDNKKCQQSNEAILNLADNEVYCGECNKVIKNVTAIMKNQLKFAGQTMKNKKSEGGFNVVCNSCKSQGTPAVEPKNKTLLCKSCGSKLNVSEPFKKLFLDSLKKK